MKEAILLYGHSIVCTRVQNVYIDNDVSRFVVCPDGIPVPPSNNGSPSGAVQYLSIDTM